LAAHRLVGAVRAQFLEEVALVVGQVDQVRSVSAASDLIQIPSDLGCTTIRRYIRYLAGGGVDANLSESANIDPSIALEVVEVLARSEEDSLLSATSRTFPGLDTLPS